MEVTLTKPQTEMLTSKHTYTLFVAGYATGKSFILIICALRDLFNNPGADIGVFSPTYDLNRLNLEPRFLETLDNMPVSYTYNKSLAIIEVAGYGKIIFRSMDNPMKIVAYEIFRAHCDEIDTLSPDRANDVWNKIIARTRQKVVIDGVAKKNTVNAYSTPESFGFTYQKWGKQEIDGYGYIRAATYSNPHLPDDYIENLQSSYPSQLIDAYIEGIWTNLTSGSVYPYFDRERCHTSATVKKGEPLHIGMDFNSYHMAAVVFNDRLEAIDEFVDYADTPAMCQAIADKYSNHHITIYPDASGKAHKSVNATISDFSVIKDFGFKILARKSNPRVKDRVVTVNRLLEQGKLKVNTTACPSLTECLEIQIYDKNSEPDKKSNTDHLPDALSYRIAFSHMIQRPTFKMAQTAA